MRIMEYQGLTLDRFQAEAIKAIDRGESLVVAAPTGCGKTLVAEYAVDVSIAKNMRVIYTAPIKALSNQKYRDFKRRFGEEMVGIHTGDVTINPDARLLIMTTEIFRNLILEESPRLQNVYYVVFDEIHYLDDPERGTVWEESIILAPPAIRFMCLSATVPNIKELASWMGKVRNAPISVIEETERTIPLEQYLFSSKFGFMTIKQIKTMYRKKPSERKKFLRCKPSSYKIISYVRKHNQMPVLYFCFNRRACERNAENHAQDDFLTDAEHSKVKRMVDEFVVHYKLSGYERLGFMRQLWESGCAYHHAGILPAAKEIVERLFSEGLIKVLFCTETFALGVNMPASAVVFDELEKFDGVQFNFLMTREYNQMAGRAGRRGMDDVGYVYAQVVPEAADPSEIERILSGKNEKIQSRFSASYSTILNLYSRCGEDSIALFRRSFRNFKQGEFTYTKSYAFEEEQIRKRIAFLQSTGFLDGTALTEKGTLAAAVNGYEIQCAELYYSRSFEECTMEQIPVILVGLITNDSRRKAKDQDEGSVRLRFAAEKIITRLAKLETKFGIASPISEMNLSLAAPVFAWVNGCSLRELERFGVPEGDLIRSMRMVVQLLRTLREKVPDPFIADLMHNAMLKINRDVVDAQAELAVELPSFG